MLKHMKTATLTALGGVALGATLFGGIPALAAGNGAGYGGAGLQTGIIQTVSTRDRTCTAFVDADGDGLCDACGSAAGDAHRSCVNYVDRDGDGVCDRCEAASGTRFRNGSGAGYVDADADGIYDNCGTGAVGGHHGHHARGPHGGRGHC